MFYEEIRVKQGLFQYHSVHYGLFTTANLFYIVKLGFTGVYFIFLISAQKNRLWVLVRNALPRRFLQVPTIYVLSRNMKNIRVFLSENCQFLDVKFSIYLKGMFS